MDFIFLRACIFGSYLQTKRITNVFLKKFITSHFSNPEILYVAKNLQNKSEHSIPNLYQANLDCQDRQKLGRRYHFGDIVQLCLKIGDWSCKLSQEIVHALKEKAIQSLVCLNLFLWRINFFKKCNKFLMHFLFQYYPKIFAQILHLKIV